MSEFPQTPKRLKRLLFSDADSDTSFSIRRFNLKLRFTSCHSIVPPSRYIAPFFGTCAHVGELLKTGNAEWLRTIWSDKATGRQEIRWVNYHWHSKRGASGGLCPLQFHLSTKFNINSTRVGPPEVSNHSSLFQPIDWILWKKLVVNRDLRIYTKFPLLYTHGNLLEVIQHFLSSIAIFSSPRYNPVSFASTVQRVIFNFFFFLKNYPLFRLL